MNEATRHGYLVLADISGYTSYLAGVELTHAQDVLTELLELIVEHFKPLLTIVKLEGDAVFAHTPQTSIQRHGILLDLFESTYLSFRDQVVSILRRTTCECKACKSIPNLDLKFILHFGEYLQQNVSGITELVGSDVNLAHRLLKNHVSEATGWKAYALFTGAGLSQMNLELENLHEQVEAYEHLGEVKTYSLDLHARYKELVEARRVDVSPEEADDIVTCTIPASPVIVWDWLNDIQKRLQWEVYDDIRPVLRPGGRIGAGASNHCAHGKDVVLEKIVDWRPFEYYTAEYPMGIRSHHLLSLPEGTRLSVYFKLKMGLPRWLTRFISNMMNKRFRIYKQYDTLSQLVGAETGRLESERS
jgi:class 3 adenylate cyclase